MVFGVGLLVQRQIVVFGVTISAEANSGWGTISAEANSGVWGVTISAEANSGVWGGDY